MQLFHLGEGVDDAVITVTQQMREVVRQFGVVHEDQVRAGGAVQVDQVRPQADSDPVRAQDRQLTGRSSLQDGVDRTLLFLPGRADSPRPREGTVARFGYTAPIGTTDDGRFRRLTVHLPTYAQRLFNARDAGASDQQMRQIIAEGFKDIYFQDNGTRALGLNDIDYLDLDY
ncbi:telomere-protecting terminal protein Tpg [Streptomyces viridochromogenes]|uniref:telomere-protecting terminal protein Tpg n=1 Tax=Streptomyces viridochromogenes TaxID=1938 RepID=UPI001F3FC856|nr:hypothetical protein [Streptomyces viridochromogenes]